MDTIGRSDSMADEAGDWQAETLLVRGGTLRSAFGETSEALYVNSGFI